jgi:excisionase family DNA binding protein
MTNAPKELITINDAKRICGLEKTTLYRLVREGKLRSFRVLGHALRFDREDVLELVQEHPRLTAV